MAPPGGSTFITREIEIPSSPENSPPPSSSGRLSGPRSSTGHSNGHGSSSAGAGSGGGGNGGHPLPALPSALMDALAREPPSRGGGGDGGGGGGPGASGYAPTTSQGRSSLSFSRPSGTTSATASPATSSDPSFRTPALPALPPHSPLNLPYRDQSPGSPNRSGSLNEKNVASSRTKSTLTRENPDPRNRSGSPSGRVGRSNVSSMAQGDMLLSDFDPSSRQYGLGEGFVSAGQGDYASPKLDESERAGSGAKRSMWKAVGFGRTRTSESANKSISSTWSRLGGGSSGANGGPDSAGPAGWPTGTGSPATIHSRTPLLTTTSSSPVVASPSSSPPPSPSRRGSTSPVVSRSPSTSRLRVASSQTSATKWLYESQAVGSDRGDRKGATSPILGGPGATIGLGLGEDDVEQLEPEPRVRSRGSTPGHLSAIPVEESDEDDDGDGLNPWGAGAGQQYTHDLTKGLRRGAPVYESDVEEETDEELGDVESDAYGEGEGEEDLEHLVVVEASPTLVLARPPLPPSGETDDTLGARRRRGTPPRIATERTSADQGPRTAPLVSSLPTPRASELNGIVPEGVRNRSWSDGDVALGKAPQVEDVQVSPVIGPGQPQPSSGTRSKKVDFSIAIVGPRNVGKSTVIRKGLKSSSRPSIVLEDQAGNKVMSYRTTFALNGRSRRIEVLEIDSALLQLNDEGVLWPEQLPTCEGFMVCFDATDPSTVPTLVSLLQGFWMRGTRTSMIVLACKASRTGENVVSLEETAAKCNPFGNGIVSLDGGVEDQGHKMQDSVRYLLHRISKTRGDVRTSISSVHSADNSPKGAPVSKIADALPSKTSAPISPATLVSELSATAGDTSSSSAIQFENPFAIPARVEGSNGRSAPLGLEVVQEAPVGEEVVAPRPPPPPTTQEAASEPAERNGGGEVHPFPSKGGPTHLETLESLDKMNKNNSSALDLHFSREDMIDKFLFASVTGNDEAYVTLFLIVYRRFVRPYDVVSKLIQRFEFVNGRLKTDPLLSRFAQMKLCGTLSTWFSYYPGDFSAPSTSGILRPFLEDLLPRGATWVAHHAVELLPQLSAVSHIQDPEGSWALPDKPLDETPIILQEPLNFRRPSLAPSYDSTASSFAGSHHVDSIGDNNSRLSVPGSLHQPEGSVSPSAPTTSASYSSDPRRRSNSDAATSDSNERFSSTTGSRRGGKGGSDSTLVDLSNALLELPEEVIAQQITRIAWGAFSHMTPRDLMRHVLAPRDPKNPRALLRDSDSNVMQSINFVNYLADWVATMVLIQSKLKWRARILEKFIHIAYQLRLLENFDSLMGVLAGLNSQPVFRLAETMETVNLKLEGDRTKISKRLRSLNKLMATTKSFAAYRLALANSGTEMLPYLGVHLQDITVVNEVKSDMRDGKVNWSKFSQMGRSAAIVLDCSRQPPTYSLDRVVERCILNVPLLDKDRQYALSYEYSPRAAQEGSTRVRLRKLVGKVGDTLAGTTST